MQGLNMFETGISVFFLVEYFLRFLANDGNRLKFVSSPLALIDLASFLPALINLIMPGLTSGYTALELLRLLRILRLQRFLQEDEFFKIEELLKIEASIVQLKFARVFSSLFTLLFISTGLIYSCEHTVNPAFSDFFTTLYFGLCTLTTVGFGDIVPITFEGRLVVCASILVGIGVIPLQVGELAQTFLNEGEKEGKGGVSGQRVSSSRDPIANRANVLLRTRVKYLEKEVLSLTKENKVLVKSMMKKEKKFM